MDASQLERVYREEATRIRAALAARLGDLGLAEDAVQDAFIEAIEHWRDGEIPANSGGWLATVLFLVVLLAGLALVGYTLARPFLK